MQRRIRFAVVEERPEPKRKKKIDSLLDVTENTENRGPEIMAGILYLSE